MTLFFLLVWIPLFGQTQEKVDLVGIWKLEEAGFYESGNREIKPFDACRLSRNFTFTHNGKAIYRYYEGSVADCSHGEPERYDWSMQDSVLTLKSETTTDYKIVRKLDGDAILLETYLFEKIDIPDDELTTRILNTIHYERYRRVSSPVLFKGSKAINKL